MDDPPAVRAIKADVTEHMQVTIAPFIDKPWDEIIEYMFGTADKAAQLRRVVTYAMIASDTAYLLDFFARNQENIKTADEGSRMAHIVALMLLVKDEVL